MKRIILRVLNSVKNFLNRMTNNEAERIIELYKRILGPGSKGRR